MLVMAYTYGVGVKADSVSAFEMCRSAAAKGDLYGQYNLGVCYSSGEGVASDDAEAEKWFRLAAGRGYSPAHLSLALLLDKRGDRESAAEALRLRVSAAERHNSHAKYLLAGYYARGEGLLRDLEKSHDLYLEAANAGHVKAQYELGFIYLGGRGVPKDLVSAYTYWKLAGKETSLVSGQLTPEQVERALISASMIKRQIGPSVDSWGRAQDQGRR
jgi:TPR repeat protein